MNVSVSVRVWRERVYLCTASWQRRPSHSTSSSMPSLTEPLPLSVDHARLVRLSAYVLPNRNMTSWSATCVVETMAVTAWLILHRMKGAYVIG